MNIRNTWLMLAPLAAATLFLAGCAGSTPAEPAETNPATDASAELQALYDEAIEAGQTELNYYGPQATEFANLFARFSEQFSGITVNPVFVFGADLDSRVDAEFATGNHIGDLVQVSNTPVKYAQQDRCVAFEPPTSSEVPAQYFDLDNTVIVTHMIPFGQVYNKDVIETPPTSWADLLDPEYTGQLVISRPSIGGIADTLSAALTGGVIDEEYLEALKGQDLTIVPDAQAAAAAVATGEEGIAAVLPYTPYAALKSKGANVGFAFPLEDGTYMSSFQNCILDGGPNEFVAKLFVSWLFTDEGIDELGKLGLYSPVPDAAAPADLPPLSEVPMIELPGYVEQLAQQPESVARIKSILE